MTLLEVYFYMILILIQLITFAIISCIEDLKERKYFLRYFKITLSVGIIGISMEIIGWNYLCDFQCIFITFIPFIVLILSKGIIIIFNKIFKKEPFQMYRNELSHGIWVENKGDLSNSFYYQIFTFTLFIVPMISLSLLFTLLNDSC